MMGSVGIQQPTRQGILNKFDALRRPEYDLLLPTPPPIQRLYNLEKEYKLGSLGSRIYTYRDDLSSPFSPGSNKIRKLHYALPIAIAALPEKPTAIVTSGGYQSNCCRAVAQVAAKLGLKCFVLLDEADADGKTESYASSGNLQLLRILGVQIEFMSGHDQEDNASQIEYYKRRAEEYVRQVESQGERVLYIPPGASGMVGCGLGHARCALDILDQQRQLQLPGNKRFNYIVVASASGSTVGGLVAGAKLAQETGQLRQEEAPKIVGIEAAGDEVGPHAERALRAARETVKLLGLSEDCLSANDITIDGRWLGPEYGDCDPAAHQALLRVARTEGLFLDPVYTCKAMNAILQSVVDGEMSGNILFVHTGGQVVMSAYPGVEKD